MPKNGKKKFLRLVNRKLITTGVQAAEIQCLVRLIEQRKRTQGVCACACVRAAVLQSVPKTNTEPTCSFCSTDICCSSNKTGLLFPPVLCFHFHEYFILQNFSEDKIQINGNSSEVFSLNSIDIFYFFFANIQFWG